MATIEPDETSYAHAPTNASPEVAATANAAADPPTTTGGGASIATADRFEGDGPDLGLRSDVDLGGTDADIDTDIDADIDLDEEDADTEEGRAAAEHRPDVASWVLTPVVVLLLGPALAAIVMFIGVQTESGYRGYPAVCPDGAPQQCGGVVLGIVAEHVIAFVLGWLFLWAIPWRRGMRGYRYALAVIVILVLVAAPLRLLGGAGD